MNENRFCSAARGCRWRVIATVWALGLALVSWSSSAPGQVTTSGLRAQQRTITFRGEVSGILTKRGCNSSECHGGVKGRGGFKLSLDAIDPRDDYGWIVEGGGYQVLSPESLKPIEPRVDLEEPTRSLLLLKPTETVPHEGGLRLESGSADYRTILDWIRGGAPYGDATPVHVERIEVSPRRAALAPDATHPLLVTAHFSDGGQRDITDQVRYESLRPEVVKVSAGGSVQAIDKGESTVLVRAVGHLATAQFRVTDNPVADFPEIGRINFIDEHVLDKLKAFHLAPSQLSVDSEFLRRVCLDLTGTVPPPDRVRQFLSDNAPDKRNRLVEILLDSPEYNEFWTFRFADLFRVGGGYGWVHLYWEWVRESVAHNKPYDQMAREIIAAQGYNGPSRVYLLRDNKPVLMERVVAEQFRLFMGRRLDCAQCHNHPFDRWSQNQFWGLAAFYGGMTNTEWFGDNVVFDDENGHEVNFGEQGEELSFRQAIHPRTSQKVAPRFPDGRLLTESERRDPRAALAAWMSSHSYFAEAAVNRIWGYFFGRGIVNPVDDFRLANPPSHPALLRALADDFVEHRYDLKHLMRRIVQSRIYQLSSTPNETNRDDTVNYSHAQPRRMEAEVLLDAISSATGVPEVFEKEGADQGTPPPGTRAINLKHPATFSSRFLEVYGRPLRFVVPERDDRASLSQALHMLVGSTYTEKLTGKGGRIDQLLGSTATNREVIEELYLATLCRPPSEDEADDLERVIEARPERAAAIADLMWALVCSREFADNH